ncbi:MAG: hypothetical protein CM15mP58_17760 [Burkholderiaceae bacterium]|nr:MAG: hypothetical protein CM15mP58_17760 [Burkholderiaceae bacterium]
MVMKFLQNLLKDILNHLTINDKRYSRKELVDIWSEENKYKIWLDVEIAAAQAMEKLGQIPKGFFNCQTKAKINVKEFTKD